MGPKGCSNYPGLHFPEITRFILAILFVGDKLLTLLCVS